jgi:hypothetical protein
MMTLRDSKKESGIKDTRKAIPLRDLKVGIPLRVSTACETKSSVRT